MSCNTLKRDADYLCNVTCGMTDYFQLVFRCGRLQPVQACQNVLCVQDKKPIFWIPLTNSTLSYGNISIFYSVLTFHGITGTQITSGLLRIDIVLLTFVVPCQTFYVIYKTFCICIALADVILIINIAFLIQVSLTNLQLYWFYFWSNFSLSSFGSLALLCGSLSWLSDV